MWTAFPADQTARTHTPAVALPTRTMRHSRAIVRGPCMGVRIISSEGMKENLFVGFSRNVQVSLPICISSVKHLARSKPLVQTLASMERSQGTRKQSFSGIQVPTYMHTTAHAHVPCKDIPAPPLPAPLLLRQWQQRSNLFKAPRLL